MGKDNEIINNEVKVRKKKSREVPHILIILGIIIVIATIMTWIVPAGSYDRYLDEASGKELIDPKSFHRVAQTPVNPFDMFVNVEKGLIEAANITFLIFAAFASLYLLQRTGAVDAAIAAMVRKTQKNPKMAKVFIVVVMVVLSVWGSTGTMSYEEIIAFIPIFVSVSIALGYDPMVGVGMSVVPVGVGFASATVNPFTIGVAQTIAEIPIFSGLGFRIVILAVMTAITITYVLVYAEKVKKHPEKSFMYGIDMSHLEVNGQQLNTEMTTARKLTLIVLLLTVCVMGWGLLTQGWYINEVAGLFMILAVVVGIINKWTPNKIAKTYVEGLANGVMAALIVGFARAILTICIAGNIIDTIVHACVSMIEGLSLYLSGIAMLVFQTVLNFLIPSGSGQAAVSMPIMTPIADIIGMNRQIAVLIFQFGDGLSNLIIPTGFMVIACVMAKIPLGKYYKWIMPLFSICFLAQIGFVFLAIATNYS
ncbi:MAG: AbgT family transporter [Clostridiales bacterium]|nr:AbgT family transporter [Clostridiales bacterium]